jgi:hypothetical protein
MAIKADKHRRHAGRSAKPGLPATSHIKAGIPTMKMAKPRKYPRTCFIIE